MKVRVGILVGGASSEREISLASGRMIAEHLPRERYEVVVLDTLALMAANPKLSPALRERAQALVAGSPTVERRALSEGEAALPDELREQIRTFADTAIPATAALAPSGAGRRIDVAFLALHGPYGEDGTVQGLLELIGIPYVGSGVLASALAMDKAMARTVLTAAGVPVARGIVVEHAAFVRDGEGEARRALPLLPAVVKPVREGSSIGMSLVPDASAVRPALEQAFRYDSRVLVEERVMGTELTVGLIGNDDLQALPVVEIVPRRDFFDYRAKYDPTQAEEICPARIPDAVAGEAQQLAIRAHRALQCRGLSRVDMIHGAHGFAVLEVNTLPGMTVNSLLPRAARAAGMSFSDLLDRLVRLALEL